MNHHRASLFQGRREFLHTSALGAAATAVAAMGMTSRLESAETSDLVAPAQLPSRPSTIKVLMPRDRVPLSFIIDDSTCLVNMGHFCNPQFATAWPDRAEYQKPWRSWPREIPDAFVRQFGDWCAAEGVKGKYSIVPYPACVGWLDRELPEGFNSFKRIVNSLASRFADDTMWMKVSEIGRYWAAKDLTEINRTGDRLTLTAPFAAKNFTLQILDASGPVSIRQGNDRAPLSKATNRFTLNSGTWIAEERTLVVCFDLPKGTSEIFLNVSS